MTETTPIQTPQGGTDGVAITILLVDDDQSLLALYGSLLQKAGNAVLQAKDSSEAWDLCQLQAGPIHLVIAHVMLPPQALRLAEAKTTWPPMHGRSSWSGSRR